LRFDKRSDQKRWSEATTLDTSNFGRRKLKIPSQLIDVRECFKNEKWFKWTIWIELSENSRTYYAQSTIPISAERPDEPGCWLTREEIGTLRTAGQGTSKTSTRITSECFSWMFNVYHTVRHVKRTTT
jgi:hypothetical protein